MYDYSLDVIRARPRLLTRARRDFPVDMAEDAVSECIFRFYKYERYNEDKGDVGGFLFVILTHVLVDFHRTRAREEALLEHLEDCPPIPSIPFSIDTAIAQIDASDLPSEAKAVATLRLQGKTHAEISTVLNCSISMSNYHLAAAREGLRHIELGYGSPEECFHACSQKHVYRAPPSAGSSLGRARLARLQ